MPYNTALPIDFPIPPNTLLDNGTLLVYLPTLDELEAFWTKNAHRFPYAVQGLEWGDKQSFLNPCEWLFGPTKAAVVNTVCRWDQVGIQCEWYDWVGEDPQGHAWWFEWRSDERVKRIAVDSWTEEDEADYQEDVVARTPETFRGRWELSNLPCMMTDSEWFGPYCTKRCEDRNWSKQKVTQMMQEKTFDAWKAMGADEVEFLTADDVDSVIAYWQHERAVGEDYYGSENEAR